MSGPARLSGDLPPEFSRPAIDTAQPIRFRLNGRVVDGFAGDTVLSALMASGVASTGLFEKPPVALDDHSAPAIAVAGNEHRADLAMPMALCPALDGVSYVTPDARPSRPRLFSRAGSSLDLEFGTAIAPGGWIDAPPIRQITADVIVVGGGVAGLSAAIEAAERGLRVCLVEKDVVLGGMSEFFGKAEGEPAPDALIAELASRIGETGLVKLLLGTLAFDLSENRIEAIRVITSGALPQPERLALTADTIVLATGTAGRLPVFPGNRLPGVVEAGFAWRMAARYNVWSGSSAHIHTAANAGYRLALLGAASGKTIMRTSDPRIDPQTRFIEFCKAYGYRLGWGVTPARVEARRGDSLAIALADAVSGTLAEEAIDADRLIVSGGWQPALDLWVRASGRVTWHPAAQRLVADGALAGVVLAGSVAGYHTLVGCTEHGRAALAMALDGTIHTVPDTGIDPIFDTPDGPLTLSPPVADAAPAFISLAGLRTLTPPPRQGLAHFFARRSTSGPGWTALTISDVVGEIIAGRLDPAFAGAFCAERCVVPRALVAPPVPPHIPSHLDDALPPWLDGRFGAGQAQWSLRPAEPRRFEPGCLIFANTDHRSPLDAVGVIVHGAPGSTRALMQRPGIRVGETVYIRDGLTTTSARLSARYEG
ncbi:MAG TPA: FAD-dependent oxidoreductase [Pelagibacterium sp.]|uniref:FAD-dependent oxidoreductase n=1 Tax=Pelagibacterium sp. TaxID=1967288 RepID=UPI002BD7B001|nr:FAD-dependent oxidoreductase [Pelagibacterium sp.]HWJ89254.1 FAD-dependent oxidoreductase [Pelagibacterium sp.]